MDFTGESTELGVTERRFDLKLGDETVPGLLWLPEGASTPRPKILIGHGGTQHKRVPNVLGLARQLVRHCGYAAVAIDAPGHGDRVSREDRARAAAARQEREARRGRGEALPEANVNDPYPRRFQQAVAEWRATLDAVEQLDGVGRGPTGYWGVSMGTSIGLPLSATEPRIVATVLGLASTTPRPGRSEYLGWAEKLSIPLLFLCQADDAGHPLPMAIELFLRFGTREKTMHLNPGPHVGVPRFERGDVEAFFRRHLGAGA